VTRLAAGVVAPEFAAAVASFVSATLLPTVAGALDAREHLGPLLSGPTLFPTGWFGAGGLVTVLFADGYGTSVARAAVVLSAAPLAWAVTSLVVPRKVPPAVGLALAAGGVAVLAAVVSYPVGLVAWAVAGAGIGLAYPALYLRCTPAAGPAAALATAVITAEAFGGLLGSAAGGAIASAAGLVPAYAAFAVVLAVAALVATRSATPATGVARAAAGAASGATVAGPADVRGSA
jgi:hypothetical protein